MLKSRTFAGLFIIACTLLLAVAAIGATLTYTYDNLNRLTKVDYGNGATEVYTYDSAGNRLTLTVAVDITPPNPPVVSATTLTNNTKPTWSWVLGGGDGYGTYRYQLDSETGSWTETTSSSFAPLDALSEDNHTLYVQERDAAGNWSASGSKTITIDTTAPVTTISGAPASPTNSTSATLAVGGTDVVAYMYKLDAGAYSSEASVAVHISLSGLPEGLHSVSVIGKDTAGNWQATGAATTVTWTIDTVQCQLQTWYKDADNDGYSDGTTLSACTRPSGYKLASELTAISGDSNDADPGITGTICMDMNLTEGWNLISLPVSPVVNTVTTLFPDAHAVYGFNGVYQIATNMETGKGYWIKVSSTKTYTICGHDYIDNTVTLEEGWHLMGAINGSALPLAAPSGCITAVYGFNGAFYVPNQNRMESGNGYWVKNIGICGFELSK